MEQKVTKAKRQIRVAAELDRSLVDLIDKEREGTCSRAAIVRMALLTRYGKRPVKP